MQETSPDPSAGKAAWRAWLRKSLALVTDADVRSADILRHLATLLDDTPPRTIALFSALPGEPEITDLIAPGSHHQWVLPRVVGGSLDFHVVDAVDRLLPGAFGIAEPDPALPVVEPGEIDVFLCPGLGFDRRGMRLGRGKGFYDRSLALSAADVLRIGVAFAPQLVDRLPAEDHDIPMDLVVTESGVLDCGSA